MTAPVLRRFARLPLALALPVLLQGCVAGMRTGLDEAVAPPAPVPVDRLAVMPVTTEPGSEALRSRLAEAVRIRLERDFPGVVIIGPQEVGHRLDRASLAGDYAALLEDYERTGVVDSSRLSRIAEALEVDHFLHLRAAYVQEDFLDTHAFRDEVEAEERRALGVVTRLWGERGPGPVWEAVVRTESETGEFTSRRRRVDELVTALVDRLSRALPIRGAGPAG